MILKLGKNSKGLFTRFLGLEFTGCIFIAVVFALCQYYLCLHTEKARLNLAVSTAKSEKLRVYWRANAASYSEKNSLTIDLHSGLHHYELPLPALSSLSELRIDPLDGPGAMEIRRMTLSHPFYLADHIDFARYLRANPKIAGLSAVKYEAGSGISFVSTGKDPWFTITPLKKVKHIVLAKWLLVALGGGTVLFLVLNQRFIKGRKEKGVLQVEISDFTSAGGIHWFEALEKFFPGLTLLKVIESECSRTYYFSISWRGFSDFSSLVKRLHQDHPRVHIRMQRTRSGEV